MLCSLREVQFGLSLVVLDSLVIGVIILNRVICAFNPTLQARMSVGANPKRILELIFSKFHFSQAEPKFYFKTVNTNLTNQIIIQVNVARWRSRHYQNDKTSDDCRDDFQELDECVDEDLGIKGTLLRSLHQAERDQVGGRVQRSKSHPSDQVTTKVI